MIEYSRVAERIKMSRRLSDLSRSELAQKAGLTEFVVCAIERGACEDYDAIDAVCRALNIDTQYTLDPRDKQAEAAAWSSLTDEEKRRIRNIFEMLKNGPGA